MSTMKNRIQFGLVKQLFLYTRFRVVFASLFFLSQQLMAVEWSTPDPSTVDWQWSVSIPMRDGAQLHATVYRPKNQKSPMPCLFTLTPYIADSYHARGLYFAANGYVFFSIDVRGRGASSGEFMPWRNDAEDGADIVDWLSKQKYCNGKVAMWGGSYAGTNQWLTAKMHPTGLSTIVPVASAKSGVDFPLDNNIAYPYVMQWLTLTSGRAVQRLLKNDQKFWESRFRNAYLQHWPFVELDRRFGNPSTHFQRDVAHPLVDDYFDTLGATPEQYASMSLPILTITGHYDDDQPGAMAWYREHAMHSSAAAREKHFLIIGPWDHAGTFTPMAELGGLHFGEASQLDLNALHKQWYDWTMKSGSRPEFLKDRVAYYVTAAERWRYAPTLEAVTARYEPLYLHSNGRNSNDVFSSGKLSPTAPTEALNDHYVYDPLDTAPGKDETFDETRFLIDQTSIHRNLTQSLIYHSAPLDHDTEVSGFFRFQTWLSLDQLDTDFIVKVYEILADGSSVLLTQEWQRARYRESLRREKLVVKNEILRYDFNRFYFVSRMVKKGSRLRLVFGPINSIFWQKNYNSGGVVANESAKDALTVTVTLHQGSDHASLLYVPIAASEVSKKL